MQRQLLLPISVIAIAMLSGCSEDVDSEDIRTSGIYAAINVTSHSSDQSEVEVALKVGGGNSNTYINLTGGDTLTASLNGGTPQNLGAYLPDALNPAKKIYVTTFNDPNAGITNSQFTIAFNRPNDTEAPSSVVSMPATLANFAHNAGSAAVSRLNDDIIFTWATEGLSNPLTLKVEGSCLSNYTNSSVTDNGSFTINAGTLNLLGDTTNCVATAKLSINQGGNLDPNYGEGGYIKAHKVVSTSFLSAP